jgi:hypothetical protein
MDKWSKYVMTKWLAIPRVFKKGFVTLFALIYFIIMLGKGLLVMLDVLHGDVLLSWPTIVASLVLAFVIVSIVNKQKE